MSESRLGKSDERLWRNSDGNLVIWDGFKGAGKWDLVECGRNALRCWYKGCRWDGIERFFYETF